MDLEEAVPAVEAKMEAAATKRRVMIALDDSEVSAYTYAWASRNLIREDDHVIVLSAAPLTEADFHAESEDVAIGVEYGGKGPRKHEVLAAQSQTQHAVPVDPSTDTAEAISEDTPANDFKKVINKYLQLLMHTKISCEGELVKGDAKSWIADEGVRLNADVIVVGSNASGILKRALVGSVSDYVLHNAPCTVAIVRQSEDALLVHDPLASSGGPRKIVIAVDDSQEAIIAFTWALKNFCLPQDHVILYHVHHPPVAPIPGVATGEFGLEEVYTLPAVGVKDEVAALKDSQKVVQRFMEFAENKTEIHCEGMVVTGETQQKVIEGLNALRADAVVLGTHDRSAVSRTLLGSVSDHLAHNSPCPLIVVKTKKALAIQEDAVNGHEHGQ